MAQTRQRSKRQVWIADFIVAGILAVIATYFLIDWLGERACAELGGTLRYAGADRICEMPDGSSPDAALVKGSTILYVWLGTTAVVFGLLRLFLNRDASAGRRRQLQHPPPKP